MRRYIGIGFLLGAGCLGQDIARMEQVVQSYVTDKKFMGSALVARGDEVLFSKGYGSANLEWQIPNSPSTKFRLGSITKQFTAASILLLEERGKLKVDDPVKKHMADAPASWDKITIYHLLTHSSGIPNFTSFPDYASKKVLPSPVAKTVERFRDKPLDFEPGEKFQYSNSGYILLGYLIEKLSGQSYEKFVQENIFTLLGMKDSGYDSNSTVIARRAEGYSSSPSGPVNAAFIDMSIPHGAGALYSTVEDLLKWEQGLFGGKLLSPASLQKMTSPFKGDYALGLIVTTAAGRKKLEHGGGIDGFNTHLVYFPETRVTVAVLANLNGSAPQEIAGKLSALAHGDKIVLISERKAIAMSPQILSKYVGTYELSPKSNMMIRLAGDQLTSQVSGQSRIPIFAESENTFFPKVVDAEIEFSKDANGAVTHLVLRQGGRDTKALRISDTVLERKEVRVSTEMLASYVGTYELRPGFSLAITLEGDQLMSQATGQGKIPLFAESETRFFPKVIDAQIEFFKNEQGAVTHIILNQGPASIKGIRQ
jgi:CubicO group peptidase (beta-lactamase class C family)